MNDLVLFSGDLPTVAVSDEKIPVQKKDVKFPIKEFFTSLTKNLFNSIVVSYHDTECRIRLQNSLDSYGEAFQKFKHLGFDYDLFVSDYSKYFGFIFEHIYCDGDDESFIREMAFNFMCKCLIMYCSEGHRGIKIYVKRGYDLSLTVMRVNGNITFNANFKPDIMKESAYPSLKETSDNRIHMNDHIPIVDNNKNN